MTETEKKDAPADPGAAAKAPASLKTVLGFKRGMTQVYTADGRLASVTEVEAGPCTVLRVRTPAKDGYAAVALAFGAAKPAALNKPDAGQFKAAGLQPARVVREVRVPDAAGFAVGQVVDIDGRFTPLDFVDVQGVSKGKGFAGAMKRHGFHGLPGSHGASDKERSPGSLASRRSLGRVVKGQRMAGHAGHETVTVHKIEVAAADPARHRLFLYGSVPGPVGSLVLVLATVKGRKRRRFRTEPTVLRDKMGNVIKGAGAKARAAAEKKTAAPAPAKKQER